VTRPRAQSRALCDRLRHLGARPVAVPAIAIVPPEPGGPLDAALRNLRRYDWVVLTSANGVRACLSRAQALRVDLRDQNGLRWAAVGPATASALRAAGIIVNMVPRRFLTDAIARELRDVSSRSILLPRTPAAPRALARVLRARGAKVDEVAAYRTVLAPRPLPPRVRRMIASQAIDTVLFTSASTVRGLLRLLGDRPAPLRNMTVACIGPVCAAAVVRAGLRPRIVANPHTTDGLIQALVNDRSKGASHAQRRTAR
jgi:uroporphyrinogen-III synthase